MKTAKYLMLSMLVIFGTLSPGCKTNPATGKSQLVLISREKVSLRAAGGAVLAVAGVVVLMQG